jgi:hypothetical protein
VRETSAEEGITPGAVLGGRCDPPARCAKADTCLPNAIRRGRYLADLPKTATCLRVTPASTITRITRKSFSPTQPRARHRTSLKTKRSHGNPHLFKRLTRKPAPDPRKMKLSTAEPAWTLRALRYSALTARPEIPGNPACPKTAAPTEQVHRARNRSPGTSACPSARAPSRSTP